MIYLYMFSSINLFYNRTITDIYERNLHDREQKIDRTKYIYHICLLIEFFFSFLRERVYEISTCLGIEHAVYQQHHHRLVVGHHQPIHQHL